LDCIVHHLGLVLGGRPAASFARRLMLPVSNDTLLRVVRRRTARRTNPLTVVGVDDWAFRRNRRYGTIVCDLERRRIVTLLPDREVATVRAWLTDHPEIRVVSRDRGGGYGEASAKALPDAIQVADRWHLMENASAAFLDAVRKSMRAIRAATGTPTITPEVLTSAEKLRYESYLRREDTNAAIAKLARDGLSIKQIVRRLGHSRNLVRQTLRGGRADVFRTRQRSLDAYYLFLEGQWSGGCRNGAELWRRLQALSGPFLLGCCGPDSALHLHDLVHRHHVVIEVRHDPERPCDHQKDDQKAEGERQYVVGVIGTCGDVQEEYQVHAHLRDRQHDDRNGDRGLPDEIGARDEERCRREQDGKSETDEITKHADLDADGLPVAGRQIGLLRHSMTIAHAALPRR